MCIAVPCNYWQSISWRFVSDPDSELPSSGLGKQLLADCIAISKQAMLKSCGNIKACILDMQRLDCCSVCMSGLLC